MTKTRIHARRAGVPRHRGVGDVGGHGLRCPLPPRLPWAPRACRSASLRHGRVRGNGAACHKRSEAVRRRLRRRWTAHGPVRRRRRLPRERHPPCLGGVRGRHGVHGGGADANRRRPDRSFLLDAHRSFRRRCDSPTIPRRWFGQRDASRESPTPRRSGRMSLGSRRSAQRPGAQRRPHWAARHGHPRGAPGPGHRGGHADADGRDDHRLPRLRPHLRGIRRSRSGVRQTARQRGRAALHRGCAVAALHRGCAVPDRRRGCAAADRRRGCAAADRRRGCAAADRHRGCAVPDRRRGVVAAVRTVRPRRHPSDGAGHRGFPGRPTAPYLSLWPRLWRRVPLPAARRGGE